MNKPALNREQSVEFLGVTDEVLGELVARQHLEPVETRRGWWFKVCHLRWVREVLERCRQVARARAIRQRRSMEKRKAPQAAGTPIERA